MKNTAGVVHSAGCPPGLEVNPGVGIISLARVCSSHVSDEEEEEQISLSIMVAGFCHMSYVLLHVLGD